MELSLGPFITCCIITVCLTAYFHITLYHRDTFSPYGKRMLFAGIMLIFIRMAIPLNFPFTYTLYSYSILPLATRPLTYSVPGSNISVLNILCVIWMCGAVIQLCRLTLKHIRLRRCLLPFIITRESQYTFLFDIIEDYTDSPFEIAVLPLNISPAITGLKKPILILPDIRRLTEQELKYVCAHEIMHYTKHDLWLLLLADIVCCIHWWNPLVCLMRRRFSLIMEISNDQDVLAALRSPEQAEYAELILKTVKLSMLPSSPEPAALLSFADKNPSDLQTRIKYIFSKPPEGPPSGWMQFCRTVLLCVILLFSFFFVTEASFPVSDEELGCISITPENACFIKTENRLDLYIDGDFLISLDTIPDTLEDIPVYDNKENLYEEK